MGAADRFPTSLPDFQRMFPDDGACALYLESVRWSDGFVCPRCNGTAEPMRLGRPHLLRCRNCKRDISLTAGTVMDRTHTPLNTWFWAAYLVSSLMSGVSAVQLQRQLGLSRYETAFQIHKLCAGMVRPGRDRIGGRGKEHVEIDETYGGGETRGKGRGVLYNNQDVFRYIISTVFTGTNAGFEPPLLWETAATRAGTEDEGYNHYASYSSRVEAEVGHQLALVARALARGRYLNRHAKAKRYSHSHHRNSTTTAVPPRKG